MDSITKSTNVAKHNKNSELIRESTDSVSESGSLVRRATRLEQTSEGVIYQFAATGEEILAMADISRVSRDEAGKLIGYQRPEVKNHVQDIVDYLNGEHVLFPHAVIIAFSSRVKFTNSRGPGVNDGLCSSGSICIPLPGPQQTKPGWIVDGQQRVLAIYKSNKQNLPIPICAFITDDIEVQREQFLRVNNVKPLPQGLVKELLPEVSVSISARTAPNKLPSELVNQLNSNKESPFFGLIKRASSSGSDRRETVIGDGPLIKVLKSSLLNTSGCLFRYRNITTGEADVDAIWKIIVAYWNAVKRTFPEAWGLSPKESRLMHGVGLSAMGKLMDLIIPEISISSDKLSDLIAIELLTLKMHCRWTTGKWETIGIEWDHLENVSRHQNLLTSHLVRLYADARDAKRRSAG